MGRHAYTHPHEFEQILGKLFFEGVSFFATSSRAKEVAAETRHYWRVPCRARTIRAGHEMPERYLVMLPVGGMSAPVLNLCKHAAKWIRQQEEEDIGSAGKE